MGTKTGSPWGALSPKPAGLLSQVCCFSVPWRAKEGRSCSPLVGQPERPIGSCSGATALPWPLPGLLYARLRTRPCDHWGSPAFSSEFSPGGSYLGHWPAPGRRRKPATACTPLPPPLAPSCRRPPAPASPFLPREVGARRTQQHQQHQQHQQQQQSLRSEALS